MKLAITARRFTREGQNILTELFGVKGTQTIDVPSFDAAEKEIQTFGQLHAPCNVWVRALDGRKPRGFDKWNANATRWLFDV